MIQRLKKTQMHTVAVLAVILLLTLNQTVLFTAFAPGLTEYLVTMLGMVILAFGFLVNGLYFNSQMGIKKWHHVTAYSTFFMVFNYVIGLVFLSRDNLSEMAYYLSMARLWFVIGNAVWLYADRLSLTFKDIKYKHLGVLVLLLLQLIVVLLGMPSVWAIETGAFLADAFTASILLIYVLNTFFREDMAVSRGYFYAFVALFVGQVVMTLSAMSAETLIQGHLLWILGSAFYWKEIHVSNLLVPKQETLQLQNQFNLYAKNLKKIIDKKTLQVREVNKKLIDELEYAKIIQQSLLPDRKMNYRDVTFYSEYFPCERLSGDFYDLYRLDDDHVALYLLDVSGHGISAALMTMFSSNYLKSNDQNLMRYRGFKPERNLRHFYDQFNHMNFPDEVHMVLFYATLNLSTKVLTYCSGGMNCAPIKFSKSGDVRYLDDSEGFPICRLDGFFTPEFKSEQIQLEKGDRILFFTDGLVDMEKNGVFDTDELVDFFKAHTALSANELNREITRRIDPIKNRLNDDITYILMEV
ncbi:PP2C family protein-serine/threonine phosphatase [Fusibacter tunisiensis]|uniref:Sigma-B regulation protein RsbU (Phosphoserine phosphatase) n=1 Tax=Fusibacter tunisiensis TaxID=1008308 RepID=A0ABS2MS31_9FIRM|nr:PP2C family protein-serine/threonine phosphatase [Fusibacter tunisiensis]MBM7562180.1 sigma-B regulation protein RsbU (phosphoserine phosphatase) [Fusibacter tunisiensis]